MHQAVENFRLLFFTNLNQPIAIADLRELYLSAGGSGNSFAPALSFLRQNRLLSHADPISCTELGLRRLQALPIFKNRDSGRIFLLKERLKGSTVD